MTAETVNIYFKGDFTGFFFTKQELPFSYYDDLPKEIINKLQIYKGELHNVEPLKSYESEQYYTFSSLRVESAKNIEFKGKSDAEEQAKNPINNFKSAILKDFKILDTWSLNGKTYGLIKGELIGEVEYFLNAAVQEEDALVFSEKTAPPLIVNEPAKVALEKNSGCLAWLSKWWLYLLLLMLCLLFLRECQNNEKINALRDELTSCEDIGGNAVELDRRRLRNNAGTGELTVTLMWNSEDDLDLKVIDPHSDVINYENKVSDCGGVLDIDRNAGAESVTNPIENIYWESNAAEGNYIVIVTLFKRKSNYNRIPYYLEVLVGNQLLTYEGVLTTEKEEKEVVFTNNRFEND